MPTTAETAARLIDCRDLSISTLKNGRIIHGCVMSNLYEEQLDYVDYDTIVPRFIISSADTYNKLFITNPLPSSWQKFLGEVGQERQKHHCKEPVDILWGLFNMYYDHKQLLHAHKIPGIPIDPIDQLPDYTDTNLIRKILDMSINTPSVQEVFIKSLSIQQGDAYMGIRLDKQPIIDLLRAFHLTSGYILELGSGGGIGGHLWAKHLPHVIGSDRQYHPKWYNQYWKKRSSHVQFLRIDFTNGALPFANDTISAVIMENVLSSVDPDGIRNVVTQIHPVLVENGLLITGPNVGEEQRRVWNVFQKTGNEFISVPIQT